MWRSYIIGVVGSGCFFTITNYLNTNVQLMETELPTSRYRQLLKESKFESMSFSNLKEFS